MRESPDKRELKRVLFSLITSILVTLGVAIALLQFTHTLGFTGTINGGVILFSILFAAFLYSIFSASMLQYSIQKTIAKVARNLLVAVTLALPNSLTYGTQPWWTRLLENGFLAYLFAAFVAVSVFSFEYTRLGSRPSEPPLVETV